MKLSRRHGVELRFEFAERGGHFTRYGQASKFLFHILQLSVHQANFHAKVFLPRDVLVHRPQIESDVSRPALVKVGGEHTKRCQPPFEQFQVLLYFAFHI